MSMPSKMEKAMVQITLDHPFFADVMMKYPITPRTDIPTLAVNKRGQMFYNPDFIESLPVPQIVWGICHEILHVVDLHSLRVGDRDKKLFNYAADAWINDTLRACNIGQAIPHTVNIPGSKDRTVEEIYDSLPKDPRGNGKGQGQGSGGSGQGESDSSDDQDNDDQDDGQPDDNKGIGDDILDDGEPMSEAEAKQISTEAMVNIAQAAQSAKMRGDMPAPLQKYIAERLAVKTPWHEHLEKYMMGRAKQDYKWNRPSRRYVSQGMYLPALRPEPTLGEVVIQVDISGSVSAREIEHYNGHLQRIIEQCHPEKVHVIYTDTEVQHYDEFTPEDYPVEIGYRSGGGTDMRAGFDFINDMGITPEVVITLTDGYTPFPGETAYPAVWCISNESITAPHGESIHFEVT